MNQNERSNRTGGQASEMAGRTILNVISFVLALVLFFLLGFSVIGPRLQRVASSPGSKQSNPANDSGWGRAPAPPRAAPRTKPPARPASPVVEVNEVSRDTAGAGSSASASPDAETTEQTTHPNDTTTVTPDQDNSASQPAQKVDTFYVQVGIYRDRTNAQKIAAQWADEGYSAHVRQATRDGAAIFQVVVGSAKNKADAQKAADDIRNTGKAAILTPAD